ncbi:MAG: hypothetical protein ACSHYB_17830 [Roseibacillus sp.]
MSTDFCSDLDLAESAIEGDLVAGRQVGELLLSDKLKAMLINRGASSEEAQEIQSELAAGCFSESPQRGMLFGLLAKYSGKAPLAAYLGRVALNRLISLKRRKTPEMVSVDEEDPEKPPVQLSDSSALEAEDEVIDLLKEAVRNSLRRVNQEKLVLLRLVQSYQLSQKRVGEMWGWSESKISRNLGELVVSLRDEIMAEVHGRDPWLVVEWEDFVALCGESIDLFDYDVMAEGVAAP